MVMGTQFMGRPQVYGAQPFEVRAQQYAYGGGVSPAQTFDISSIINLIIPIMGLAMVMAMMRPMMSGFSEGFGK